METTEKFKAIIDTCYDCATICELCATSSLNENASLMLNCIKASRDCAEISRLTALLLARGSDHGMHMLNECAEACDFCADQCEKFQFEWCKNCVKVCRKCATECRKDLPMEVM